jgi:hypothetical protein
MTTADAQLIELGAMFEGLVDMESQVAADVDILAIVGHAVSEIADCIVLLAADSASGMEAKARVIDYWAEHGSDRAVPVAVSLVRDLRRIWVAEVLR